MIIRCLDIETTGLDAANDAIVEIASVDLGSDGSIISTAETLVQPGRPVSPAASAIHHLIDDDLKGAPALEDVIQKFAGADAYVAHNCSFEKSFLDGILGRPSGSARTNARSASGRSWHPTAARPCVISLV